jgi:hypothetical protein
MPLGVLGAIGTGLSIASGVKSLFGGSKSSGGGGSAGAPMDYYAKYGAMAAAANSPITLAGMRYGTTLQGLAGAQGLLGSTLSTESAKTNIAQQYAEDLGAMARTRATGAANLALGAQRIAGDLAKYDASIVGGLTLNKAKTESDIARIRANVGATKDLRQNAMNIAMTGQRFFG